MHLIPQGKAPRAGRVYTAEPADDRARDIAKRRSHQATSALRVFGIRHKIRQIGGKWAIVDVVDRKVIAWSADFAKVTKRFSELAHENRPASAKAW